jgi:hypothetical protein
MSKSSPKDSDRHILDESFGQRLPQGWEFRAGRWLAMPDPVEFLKPGLVNPLNRFDVACRSWLGFAFFLGRIRVEALATG